MTSLPPGIVYLAMHLPRLATPPFVTYLLGTVASFYGYGIPVWVHRAAITFSLPVAIVVQVQWRLFKDRRAASSMGAVLPPTIPEWIPGGLRLLLGNVKSPMAGYPGERMDQILGEGNYTVNTRLFLQNRIVTAEPEYIKAVLATQFEEFEKGPEQRRRLSPLLGTGVFASDGDLWQFHRTMTRPFFKKDRISDFELFDRHSECAIEKMKSRFEEGVPVDLQDVVSRFTLDVATEFLFGHNVKSLSEVLPYPANHILGSRVPHGAEESATAKFMKSFTAGLDITSQRMRFGDHWPLKAFWKDSLGNHKKVLHDFIDPIVVSAIERKKAEHPVAEAGEETLLQNLVKFTEDPVLIRDEIMNLLVAGRDTTACLMTFTVYLLAEHPHVLDRLREEIMSRVGPTGKPTYEDFREMRYLRAVLNETLRLYPPVPSNTRISKVPTLLTPRELEKQPLYVPPGVRVSYSVLVMHRRKDLWGPDALEFDPDRFLDERLQKYLIPNPFIFLPFNAGPRICLGQQFAYHEASFFLVRLLQSFSTIALAPSAQPLESLPPPEWSSSTNTRVKNEKIRPKAHLTLYVQGGLWCKMK